MNTTTTEGPKTLRWKDRADWMYRVAVRRGLPDDVQNAAWEALSHFVEAQDLRRCYHNSRSAKSDTLSHAAREHRKGVKAYEMAKKLIFGE